MAVIVVWFVGTGSRREDKRSEVMMSMSIKQYRTAQTFLEYALLIAVAVGALLMMHNYLNRSLQGRLKAEIDKINPEGDYTLIDGRGTRSRTTTGFVYENKKGHQISWRSSWLNENFAFNAANQIPPSAWNRCEGAECDLLIVHRDIGNSDLGETAFSYLGSGDPTQADPPLGDGGIGSDVEDPAELEGLTNEVATGHNTQIHNIGAIDPASVNADQPETADPIVEAQIDYVQQAGSSPDWADPLLDLEVDLED